MYEAERGACCVCRLAQGCGENERLRPCSCEARDCPPLRTMDRMTPWHASMRHGSTLVFGPSAQPCGCVLWQPCGAASSCLSCRLVVTCARPYYVETAGTAVDHSTLAEDTLSRHDSGFGGELNVHYNYNSQGLTLYDSYTSTVGEYRNYPLGLIHKRSCGSRSPPCQPDRGRIRAPHPVCTKHIHGA